MNNIKREVIIYLNEQWYSFRDMVTVLGVRLCVFISLAQHMMKGFLFGGGSGGLACTPILFLFKSYDGRQYPAMNAIQMQIYKNIALSPWALKVIIGIIADIVPLGGYHKMPYIFASIVGAIISCVILAAAWPLPIEIVTVLIFFIVLACSTTDLLTEAVYSKKIKEEPKQAPNVVSFVWMGIFIGSLLSTIPVGLLLEYVEPHWLYFIPIPFLFLMLFPVYYNWIGEKMYTNEMSEENPFEADHISSCFSWCPNGRDWLFYYMYSEDDEEYDTFTATGHHLPPRSSSSSSEEDEEQPIVMTPNIGINLGKIRREWRYLLLALGIALLSVTTSIMGILRIDTAYLCGVSLAGSVLMILGFYLLVDETTAKIQAYVCLQNIFSISISSAEFFFLIDTAEQYPEGPHFSKTFIVITMGLIASVCSILGSLLYVLFMKQWKFRSVFYFSNGINILLGLLNVVFYKRWNKLIGIPDGAFVLGSEALMIITGMWASKSSTIMMSSLCTKNIEAIVFAILAGSSNLGASLSQYTGAYVLSLLGVNPSGAIGESHQFDNLWVASLISTLLPLITMATIPFLIPDKYQTESLLEPEPTEEMEGECYHIHANISAEIDQYIYEVEDEDTDPYLLNGVELTLTKETITQHQKQY